MIDCRRCYVNFQEEVSGNLESFVTFPMVTVMSHVLNVTMGKLDYEFHEYR